MGGVDAVSAKKLMAGLVEQLEELTDKEFGVEEASGGPLFKVAVADEFSYTDPVSTEELDHLCVRLLAADSSARLIWKLSEAGGGTATLSVYVESYMPAPELPDAAGDDGPAPADPDAPPSPLMAAVAEQLSGLVAVAE